MHYWNKNNFAGLNAIGEQYKSKEGYERFASYCLLKEKGLKKQANQEIEEFVSEIKKGSKDQRRKLAEELTTLWFWNQEIHQLISHPLHQFIYQTLEEWCDSDPGNAVVHRWFACMGGGLKHFEEAVLLDPADEISATRLIQAHLSDIDFQTHHLAESRLIGSVEELKASLKEANRYVNMIKTDELKHDVSKELDYYFKLVSAWEQYNSKEHIETFSEWSIAKGYDFKFSKIFYYHEK